MVLIYKIDYYLPGSIGFTNDIITVRRNMQYLHPDASKALLTALASSKDDITSISVMGNYIFQFFFPEDRDRAQMMVTDYTLPNNTAKVHKTLSIVANKEIADEFIAQYSKFQAAPHFFPDRIVLSETSVDKNYI